MLRVNCPKCGKASVVPDDWAARKVRCRSCGAAEVSLTDAPLTAKNARGRTGRLVAAWVLIAFAAFLLLGLWYGPHVRDRDIEELVTAPSVRALTVSVAFLLPSAIWSVLAFVLGITVYRDTRKRFDGICIMICSGAILVATLVRQFMPST